MNSPARKGTDSQPSGFTWGALLQDLNLSGMMVSGMLSLAAPAEAAEKPNCD